MSYNLTNANEKSEGQRKSPLKLTTVKLGEKHKTNIYKGSLSENNFKQNKSGKNKNVNIKQVKGDTGGTMDNKLNEQFGDINLDDKNNTETDKAKEIKPEDSPRKNSVERKKTNYHKLTSAISEPRPGFSNANSIKWDPYDKQRKNRKDFKKKKPTLRKSDATCAPVEGNLALEESKQPDDTETYTYVDDDQTYKFKYLPKNSKSVLFTKDVMVVYFNGESILNQSKEPLKKEVEQQIRNKEMRKTHLIKTQEKYNLCLF
ncbi:unnamed protein product [Brassicogethes aeneus]|uniref:Uncharacterized protein n=1 Tax=Brassicogethes aeneus TaxID=1431903 RepID=A0A9P0BJ22_BRAAE|nr:unnamed protein product [Brassicogethes aeneus]